MENPIGFHERDINNRPLFLNECERVQHQHLRPICLIGVIFWCELRGKDDKNHLYCTLNSYARGTC